MQSATSCRAAAFAAALVLSATAAADSPEYQPRMQNDIQYVSGGVGEEQQAMMSSLAQQGYNLKLVFAERGTGAYLADVHVVVADAHGRTLLDARSDGPGFFAKLPAGQYTVTAEYHGVRQTRSVHAGRNVALALYWPAEGGSAPEPASSRAPHAEGSGMSPGRAGGPAGNRY